MLVNILYKFCFQEQGDTEALKILKGVASSADKLSKVGLILGCAGIVLTVARPIVLNQRGNIKN